MPAIDQLRDTCGLRTLCGSLSHVRARLMGAIGRPAQKRPLLLTVEE
jgi:hypothetical protein